MIRINLLGGAKPKGKKGPAVTMPSFEVGNLGGPLVQIAAVLAIAGAVNFGYWYQLDRRKEIDRSADAESRSRRIANSPTSRCGTWNARSRPRPTSAAWM